MYYMYFVEGFKCVFSLNSLTLLKISFFTESLQLLQQVQNVPMHTELQVILPTGQIISVNKIVFPQYCMSTLCQCLTCP